MKTRLILALGLLFLSSPNSFAGEERKHSKPIEVDLRLESEEVAKDQDIVLKIRAKNISGEPFLLNGRLLPGKDGKVLEPINTPVIIWFVPEVEDGGKRELKAIKRIIRMKNVCKLPGNDPEYRANLFTRFDKETNKVLPGLIATAPSDTGNWKVYCQVILPHPNPEAEETMFVESNKVRFKIK